jgi:hypothetical protein
MKINNNSELVNINKKPNVVSTFVAWYVFYRFFRHSTFSFNYLPLSSVHLGFSAHITPIRAKIAT